MITFKTQKNHLPLVEFPCQKEGKDRSSWHSRITWHWHLFYLLAFIYLFILLIERVIMTTLRALFPYHRGKWHSHQPPYTTGPVSFRIIVLTRYQSPNITTKRLQMEFFQLKAKPTEFINIYVSVSLGSMSNAVGGMGKNTPPPGWSPEPPKETPLLKL